MSHIVCAGNTYKLPVRWKSIPHLWVVLTDPDDSDQVIMVSLTTHRKDSDETVVLHRGDHSFVRHKTVVYYQDARFASALSLTKAVRQGVATLHDSCGYDLLYKIQNGALESPHTPNDIKACLRRFLA